jgi:uncharacterized protein YndB with AHSA1/START domain
MATIETSTVIQRPVGEVFAFATDTEKVALWAGPVTEAKQTSEGSVGVGATWTQVTQLLGRRFESTYEVTEYEPNSRYSAKSTSGPVPIEEHLSFETVEGGTKVNLRAEVEATGFFKLAAPILTRIISRQVENDVGTLKDLLEAQT